jgi:hypothetical protein
MKRTLLAVAAVFWAAAARADGLDVNVYPNPVRVYAGASRVTFDRITQPLRLRIYDMQGALVTETTLDGGASTFSWDLTNDEGDMVASGVYVYLLTDDAGDKQSGKLAVIR